MIAVCGAIVFTRYSKAELRTATAEAAPTWTDAHWVALAFVPSA